MADALTSLLNLAPSLVNLATGLVGASDEAKRNAQLIQFQNAIIQFQSLIATVQAENASLVRQKGDLENQLASMKAWEAEKQRYALAIPFTGVTVYALKKSVSNGEPPHYICANCYQKGIRSMVQHVRAKEGNINIVCAACRTEGHTRYRGLGPAKYAEDIRTEE